MSARDAESGSSSYKGGSGRAGGLGNGGIGGGMGGGGNYGGGMGGGAGRNGGIGNQTGLTTGNRMYGGMAYGRPGGMAQNPGAWGISMPRTGVNQRPLNRPAVPGLLGPTPAAMPGVTPIPEYVPQLPDMYYPAYTTPETVPGVPEPAQVPRPASALPNANWLRTNSMLNAPNINRPYNPGLMNLNRIDNGPVYRSGPTINETAGMPGRGYHRGPN